MYQEPSEEDFKKVFDDIIFKKLRSIDPHSSSALVFLSNAERDQVEALEDKVDPILWGYREHNERTSIRNKYSMAVSIRLAKKENSIERHERVSTDALNHKASEIQLAWSKVRFLLFYFDIDLSDGMQWGGHIFKTNLSSSSKRHRLYIIGGGPFSRGGQVTRRIGTEVEGPVLDERELEVPKDQEFFLRIDLGEQFPTMNYGEDDIPKIISEVTEMMRVGAYLGITRRQEALLSYLMTRPLIKIEKSRHDHKDDEEESKKKEKVTPRNIIPYRYPEDICKEWGWCQSTSKLYGIFPSSNREIFEVIIDKIISSGYGEPIFLSEEERDEASEGRYPWLGVSTSKWNIYSSLIPWVYEVAKVKTLGKRSCNETRYAKMVSLTIAKTKGLKNTNGHDFYNAAQKFCEKTVDAWIKARFLTWYFDIEISWSRFSEAGHYNENNEWVDEVVYNGDDRKNLDCTKIIDEISPLLRIGAYLGLTRQEEALLKRTMLEYDLDL